MPSPTRPAVIPIWTVGNLPARVQPTDGEQTTGFVANFRPPAKWHNWLFGEMSDWIAWLDFITNPSVSTTIVPTANTVLAFPIGLCLGNPVGGGFNVTFPTASANSGYKCSIKNISATNNLTVLVHAGDKLEGVTNGTATIPPGESYNFGCDGTTGYWQY